MSQLKKVLITVPDTLLEQVDEMASSAQMNRSEFVRNAMKLYLAETKRKAMREQMQSGYREMAEINLALAELCAAADSEQLKQYEDRLAECE